MRLSAFILLVHISLLNFQPAFCSVNNADCKKIEKSGANKDCCSKENTCQKEETSSNENNQNKNCCESLCNPFANCGCCINLPVERPSYNEVWVFTNESLSFSSANLTSNYIADCFQPPESV